MTKYLNWKWTTGASIGGGQYIVEIDCDGISWYDLMKELDAKDDRVVVCVSPTGYVAWYTEGKVSERYAPSEGFSVIVLESVPFTEETQRQFLWDGSKFITKPNEVVERTKEDIMADLLKLQEELKAL